MRSIDPETKELMAALKARCKAIGVTQEELATKLGVSLPTLKRWFAGTGVALENVFQLLNALDITLNDIVSVLPHVITKTFTYTQKQEDFFLSNLEYLSYFDQLIQGKSPKQIERSFKISARATRKYLKELEIIGLIEVHPHDKVKLCVHGEPVWRENGKLALALREKAIAEYIRSTASRRDDLTLFLHNYSSKDLAELRSEIVALMQKAQSFNRRSSIIEGHSMSYGLMIGLAPFKLSFLDDVKEI